MRIMKVILLFAVLLPAAVWAQDEATTEESIEGRVEKEMPRVNEILKIIGLPGIAEETRESGVPDEDVRIILEEAEKQGLPPTETEAILEDGGEAARQNGPIDNFGAFVQEKLDEGLRGPDLAAAIHAEHQVRGKGKGNVANRERHQGKGKGKGKGQDHPQPEHDGDDEVDQDDGKKHGGRDKNKKGGGK